MVFSTTFNHFNNGLKTVVFLAFTLIVAQQVQAQEVKLTPRNGNALYIGVENPVQVTVPGIPSDNIYVASDGISTEKLDNGLFNIRVDRPGKVTLTVHGDGFQYKNFDFEVKEIPDPMKKSADPVAALKLSNGLLKPDGNMTAAEFKQAVGLGAYLPKFVGNAPVGIVSYHMVYAPKEGDPIEILLTTADFNEKALGLVSSATAGDRYYFQQVNGSVIGETEARPINSLVFKIK